MSKKIITFIASVVLTGLVAAAVLVFEMPNSLFNMNRVFAQDMAEEIKEKYGQEDEEFVYNEALVNVPRGQMFTYELEFDYYSPGAGFELEDIIDVFLDAEFSVPAESNKRCDPVTGSITISPPFVPNFLSWDVWWEEDEGFSSADWKYRYQDWGYAPGYYIVTYVDPAGEKYERPVVTMFTVQNDLAAPNVEYYFKDGHLGLIWDPVPGADEYAICKASVNSDGGYSVTKLGGTADTDFLYIDPNEDETSMNYELYVDQDSSLRQPYFLFVQAGSGDDFSNISNPVYDKEIISSLPYAFDYGSAEDEDVEHWAGAISGLGLFRAVEMLDGNVIRMPVSYDIDNACLRETLLADESIGDDGAYAYSNASTHDALAIPYKIVGTPLEGWVYIEDYDRTTMRQELEKLKERESNAQSDAGLVSPSFDFNIDDTDEPASNTPYTLSREGFNVFATNAFSEYLAINMLNGVVEIDISDFNERFDMDAMLAAINEAFYQNPLILGISGYGCNFSKTTLFVEYKETRSEQQRKQTALKKEAFNVVGRIIVQGMSDLEKELAINDYLCETAEYDYAALANAEENNFLNVDSEFDDSFTAYGALINKTGVCQSYAMAFKLLADEAGLESIVVTGNLYGSLPHAWNRALVEGSWMTIDSTNNDNEGMPNNLFNIPDSVACQVLVENSDFVSVDTVAYSGQNENLEYYRLNGKYYGMPEIADILVADIMREGYALLRTDYDMDDSQFLDIVLDVLEKGGWSAYEIDGTHWLGTIYLALE
ncbi:MAG: transglutaminase-like domain-containing protein [Clostridiales bacterium]|nr:transglutaminase-like domain-containing protein [Clostridiales bacterium]